MLNKLNPLYESTAGVVVGALDGGLPRAAYAAGITVANSLIIQRMIINKLVSKIKLCRTKQEAMEELGENGFWDTILGGVISMISYKSQLLKELRSYKGEDWKDHMIEYIASTRSKVMLKRVIRHALYAGTIGAIRGGMIGSTY